MDSTLFDRLVKVFSDRRRRRETVKLFARTGLAALAATLGRDQVSAKKKRRRRNKHKKKKRTGNINRCCGRACSLITESCSLSCANTCDSSLPCCGTATGLVRCANHIKPECDVLFPGRRCCFDETGPCTTDCDCCGSLECDLDPGVCGNFCREHGTACQFHEDCCDFPDDECGADGCGVRTVCCSLDGVACTTDCDCCAPLTCRSDGACGGPCRESQESCQENEDCCLFPEDVCATNSCGAKDVCCSLFGSTCSDDCDCCVPFKCDPDLNQCVSPSCLPPETPCPSDDPERCCQEGETCCTAGPNPKCCPAGTACTAEGCIPPCPEDSNACDFGAEVICGQGDPLFAGCKCFGVGEFSFCARPTRCTACQDDPDCRGQGGHPAALCIDCPMCLPPDPPTMCVVPCIV